MGRIPLLGVGNPPAAGGGGGGFTPPAISGIISIWRADLGVTAPGGNVTAVNDQVGSNHLTALHDAGGILPFSATGLNGRPAFVYEASQGTWLEKNPFSMPAAATVWVVCQMVPTFASVGCFSYVGSGGGIDYDNPANLAIARQATNDVMSIDRANTSALQNITASATIRLVATLADAVSTLYVNNIAGTPSSHASGGLGSGGVLRVGARNISGPGYYWTGPISEVGVSSSILTSTERSTLDAYLTAAWGT